MRALVLCVGNELAADDGVGIRVGRILQRLPLPPMVEVRLLRSVGFDILEWFEKDQRLVIVDASVTGREPGTCIEMQTAEIEEMSQTPLCVHGIGIAELLQLASKLQPDRVPARVDLLGVEAGVLDQFQTQLSPAVRDAIPKVVRLVLRLVGADDASVNAGEREAENAKAWDPEPLDAVTG